MLKTTLSVIFLSLSFVSLSLAQGGSSTSSTGAKSAETAEEKTPAFRPTKEQVTQGQKFLKEQKLYAGEATGIYNDDTRGAIKQYQKANGLAITGNFNQATLAKMNIALTEKQKGGSVATTTAKSGDPASAKASATSENSTKSNPSTTSEPKRPAPFRANEEQITAAQKILRDGKMLTGGEDGKLDDLTREGLGKYQEANGLKVTKTLNAVTLEKMGIALNGKQKEQVAAQAAYDAAKASSKEQ